MIERLAGRPELVIAGLMTGTSLDGLDIAICHIPRAPARPGLLAARTVPLPGALKSDIAAAMAGHADAIARLDIALGRFYARELKAVIDAHGMTIDAVGCHGQTIYHEHGRTTLQIGEPGFMAQALGRPVISDFRRADIVAGGCGAPLVPVFDIAMFADDDEGAIALNIGGIANITAIPAQSSEAQPLAFDTGPGNMVIDGLIRQMTGGRRWLDESGRSAALGRVDLDLLDRLMRHPFLQRPPPRSAGREDFGDAFCKRLVAEASPRGEQDWHDLLATTTAWTAASIIQSIREFVLPEFDVQRLVVGGGGVHNRTLMQALEQRSNQLAIESMDAKGVDPDYREAMAFAFLAARTIRGEPGNLPRATGAAFPARLGRITLPPSIPED